MLAKKPKGATQKRKGSGLASLIWMFVGAILTLMIGLFLYLWNPFEMGVETPTPERSSVQPIDQSNGEEGNYEFYDLLPEQEIITIPDESINIEQFPDDNDVANDNNNNNDIEPDVVVNVPQSENAEGNSDTNGSNSSNSSNSNSGGNYGISEETILNPLQSQNSQTAPNNRASNSDEMIIVEEEGTYDTPSSRNGATQSADTNPAPTNPTPANSANSNRPNNSAQASGTGSAAITASKPKKTYILQINSFSNAEEADKRRAQVLMAGVDAKVVKSKMQNGQTFYQVISAKMTNRQTVMLAQQKLQNNGIDSLIVEQRY